MLGRSAACKRALYAFKDVQKESCVAAITLWPVYQVVHLFQLHQAHQMLNPEKDRCF